MKLMGYVGWTAAAILLGLFLSVRDLDLTAQENYKRLTDAWAQCSPAVYVDSDDPQSAQVPAGSYACIYLKSGGYGRLIWRTVQDQPGAPFVAHIEHLYVPLGTWRK